ncbi:MAG TPA: helix-turn-helix transcriptional regulator [Armatimonadota bacterium]|jgi:transcriptional regulator with XRE-family HTH domain
MARRAFRPLPTVQGNLVELGTNLRLARLRRRLTALQVSERAGIDRTTLRRIERGDGSVSMGAYASVLFCLGLHEDLAQVARDDELGRKLQDIGMPVRARAPKADRSDQGDPQ